MLKLKCKSKFFFRLVIVVFITATSSIAFSSNSILNKSSGMSNLENPNLITSPSSISYLCIPKEAIGFVFNAIKKSWEPTVFHAGDSKILLKEVKDG